MTEPVRDELAVLLKQHAYLEGDFLLRSGRRSKPPPVLPVSVSTRARFSDPSA